MSAPSQTAADLRAAAEVLRRDGWTQRAVTDGAGRHCAAGALLETATDYITSVTAFAQHLVDTGEKQPGENVAEWNDAAGRTADEVIAALETAADAAEADDAFFRAQAYLRSMEANQ